MRRHLFRGAIGAGLAAMLIAVTPATSHAGGGPVNLLVVGVAQCDTAGPVGRYQINWTVTNNSAFPVTVTSAVESGAVTGNVTLSPNPINSEENATGSDGPFPGTTTGVVTLTVTANGQGQPGEQSIGTVQLPGTCAVAASSTTTSTTTTTTAPGSTSTSAATRAVAVTPRFTG